MAEVGQHPVGLRGYRKMNPVQQQTLRLIDSALTELHNHRMEQFRRAEHTFTPLRRTPKVGFERLVTAELYRALQDGFGNESVFMEYPGVATERIDVYIHKTDPAGDLKALMEVKMYHGKAPAAYQHDFNKLKQALANSPGILAVQVHFNYYANRNQSNQLFMRSCAESLDRGEYCYLADPIPDANTQQNFYRLAFVRI